MKIYAHWDTNSLIKFMTNQQPHDVEIVYPKKKKGSI